MKADKRNNHRRRSCCRRQKQNDRESQSVVTTTVREEFLTVILNVLEIAALTWSHDNILYDITALYAASIICIKSTEMWTTRHWHRLHFQRNELQTHLQQTTCSIFTGRYLDRISDVLLIRHLWKQNMTRRWVKQVQI